MTKQENYPIHTEQFEVVMIKAGASQLGCTPDDLKRVPVVASSPLGAIISDEISAVEGYVAICAAKPGVLSEVEAMAMRRRLEGEVPDRSKI